jgi:PST family polysaccharide transporter
VFATGLCNWFLNNLDRLLIGRLLNAQSVGLYVVGYNLAAAPNGLVLGALQPAFHTAGARIQDEPERLRRVYVSVLASVWVLVTPVFVLLALVAQDLVGTLYGPAWESSGLVLAIIALAMPAYITWGMSTPILWNTGRKHWESLLQLPVLVAAAWAFFRFGGEGIVVVALVTASVLSARALVITIAACRCLAVRPGELLPSAARGAGLSMLAALGAMGGLRLGRMLAETHWVAFVTASLAGLAAVTSASLLCPRLLGRTVIDMVGRFVPSLPASLAAFARAAP